MATKEEKEYRAQQIAAAAQSLVAGRERAQTVSRGSLAPPSLRQSGDLSRYNIAYSDDPAARARAAAAAAAARAAAAAAGTGSAAPRPRPSGGTTTVSQPRAGSAAPPRTQAQVQTTAKLLSQTGRAQGTLYEGRGDQYTGLTITQAKAVKPTKAKGTSRTGGKRATGARAQAARSRQKAGGARIKAKGTTKPTGERATLTLKTTSTAR